MLGRFARNGKQEPQEEAARQQLRRERLPLERALLWRPLPDSYHLLASMMRAPQDQAQLFVTQRAFLQVERHLRSAPELELGGFLAGHVCMCPRSHTRYSVVNTIVPFAEVSGEPLGARVTRKAYETVRSRLDAHGLALIGWYRNASCLGLQLLPDDIDTHLEYFSEPWQTTMLVLPDAVRPRGAFFTYHLRVGRGYCIPFYELFDAHHADAKRFNRSCVTWTTYVPAEPVEAAETADREVIETTVSPQRSEPEPQPPEPLDEWIDAIKDPWVRLKDVAASPKRPDGEPIPLIFEPSAQGSSTVPVPLEQLPKAPPSPDESALGSEPVAVASERTERPKSEAGPSRPAPPFAGPPRSGVAESRTAAPPVRPRAAVPTPKPRAIPAVKAAAMHGAAAAVPAVLLPTDFDNETKRWRRLRQVGFAVAAASLLGALALSTVRFRSGRVAQAATNEAVARDAPVPVVAAAENATASIPLSSGVDSLAGALAYYRDVADKHRGGVVGCRVLDRAYSRVARARIRVDSMRRNIQGVLTDADSIRASMLAAEFTHVSQIYLRSGCR